MTDTVNLPLTSCYPCPNRKAAKFYTEDSWDNETEWACGAVTNDRVADKYDKAGSSLLSYKRISILSTFDKIPSIPSWCPLR